MVALPVSEDMTDDMYTTFHFNCQPPIPFGSGVLSYFLVKCDLQLKSILGNIIHSWIIFCQGFLQNKHSATYTLVFTPAVTSLLFSIAIVQHMELLHRPENLGSHLSIWDTYKYHITYDTTTYAQYNTLSDIMKSHSCRYVFGTLSRFQWTRTWIFQVLSTLAVSLSHWALEEGSSFWLSVPFPSLLFWSTPSLPPKLPASPSVSSTAGGGVFLHTRLSPWKPSSAKRASLKIFVPLLS